MSWSDIEKVQPKLRGLQSLFKPQPLSKEERAEYEKYGRQKSLGEYRNLSLTGKYKYIKFRNTLSRLFQEYTPDELIPVYAKTKPTHISDDTWNRLKPGDQKYVAKLQIDAINNSEYEIDNLIKNMENPSEIVIIAAVKKDGNNIRHFKKPSKAVQMEAVKENAFAIQYIRSPKIEVQLEAVKGRGEVIKYIKNPKEEVQLEAVNQNGLAINYVQDPSEEVQIAAIRQNPIALRGIKNPIDKEKMQLIALSAITKLDPSEVSKEELERTAVENNPEAIAIIDSPSEELQLLAVNQQAETVFPWIKNPSEKVQLAAVKKSGNIIHYIPNPSEEVQLAAVMQSVWAIRNIRRPTTAVQKYAISHGGYSKSLQKSYSTEVIRWAKQNGHI
jgi:hypothetical protein